MLKTIISGIGSLSNDVEQKLLSVSNVEYVTIATNQELINCLNRCDIFWFRLNHKLTEDILKNVTCKYILCAATGLDHIDVNFCLRKGIKIISLKGEKEFLKEVRATAEHTMGLMLSLIRKNKKAFLHTEKGKWNRYLFEGTELYKKKVGILGMGRLGKIVAEYCAVFGMEVYYYDIIDQDVSLEFIKTNSIEELIGNVDILSIHLPYNKDTHFILNRNIFENITSDISIINTARGGLVNEIDLINFIINNKIKGYATDVLYGEPTIKNHPLIQLAKVNENIIITPHIAGNTYESIEKTEMFIVNKLIEKLS
ncbi:NAD(P)-dependent oxidoreductase [Polaribacter sp. IC073]|uniref:NAD(P)-dependent oxidoreductase n=1 Tax=Polaribacter sp. IC073 TaxID=2508540 RepID=UPI0011BEA2F0|nr:NAD(P)-dependent oxidoreductase [Polaribacter sp. IC073]TXD49125.1 hypothetical protein ES045_03405 [Polaribacter sp. IC073]